MLRKSYLLAILVIKVVIISFKGTHNYKTLELIFKEPIDGGDLSDVECKI